MNESQIRELVQSMMTQQNGVNQFAVSTTSYHTHNGVDSFLIRQMSDLATWGTGTMSAGAFEVVDSRIQPTSVGFVTRTGPILSGTQQLACGYDSANGNWRIYESTASQSWTVFYIIIF